MVDYKELHAQVLAEEGARDQAEMEAWYQDYHHWNHCDGGDRIYSRLPYHEYVRPPNSWGFRWFRRKLGLPEIAPENPYRWFRYFRRGD